ncbi:unnamed protein product [Polarella glacialis]|uniref:tRNA:m(4)X modification enzyme TRM13 n=1 Tax=Polarella glacialis TaxID=89957 RepID=A0A813GXF2_POLGL|nr:unnamed protein product [Polarella glacialis]
MGGHCSACLPWPWLPSKGFELLRVSPPSAQAQAQSQASGDAKLREHDMPVEVVKSQINSEQLSKKQLKKQAHREGRGERKEQKKHQKQATALESALTTLSSALAEHLLQGSSGAGLPPGDSPSSHSEALPRRLCETFGTPAGRYRELPLAHGPSPAEGLAILGSSLLRPEKYGAKFLPQEYSLLHKIWVLLKGDVTGAGVLDIGAGNANCAVLAASILGLTVVCVERESPRVELRAEEQLPPGLRRRVIRVESDIEDFDTRALAEVAAAHGLSRFVLVAKHPCGIGVDRSIDCAVLLRSSPLAKVSSETCRGAMPVLVGVVMATCCTNKLSLDDFRETRVPEFCKLNSSTLPSSCHGDATGQEALVRAVEVMSRCSAWRSASGSDGNAICPEQVRWAELFEDHLQALRLRRLAEAFGDSAEVRFAPRECTLQDRCLLAAEPPMPGGLLAHSERFRDEEFLACLRNGVLALLAETGGGPIDCRPKGLKSSKYGFDYTEEMPPD